MQTICIGFITIFNIQFMIGLHINKHLTFLNSFFRFLGFCVFLISMNSLAQTITVVSSGGDTNWTSVVSGSSYIITSTSATSINASVITDALANYNVELITGAGTNNDINISAPINYTGTTTRTFSIKSNRDVLVNANIISTNSALNVVLWPNYDNAYGGVIQINTASITTNGGGIAMTGGTSTNWTPYSGASSILIGSNVAYLSDKNGVGIINSTISTSGGNILAKGYTINNTDANGYESGIKIDGSTIETLSGSVDFTGAHGANSGWTPTNYIAGVSITDSHLTTTSGVVTITGLLYTIGAYNNGSGVWIGTDIDKNTATGDVSIRSNEGSITINGNARRASGTGWDLGLGLVTYGTDDILIKSTIGDVTFIGDSLDNVSVVSQVESGGSFIVNTDGGAIKFTGNPSTTSG